MVVRRIKEYGMYNWMFAVMMMAAASFASNINLKTRPLAEAVAPVMREKSGKRRSRRK